MTRRGRLSVFVGVGVLTATLGACASTDTIELWGDQAAAWDRFQECRDETRTQTVKLKGIDPSGRVSYVGRRVDLNRMRECLEAKRGSRKGGPAIR